LKNDGVMSSLNIGRLSVNSYMNSAARHSSAVLELWKSMPVWLMLRSSWKPYPAPLTLRIESLRTWKRSTSNIFLKYKPTLNQSKFQDSPLPTKHNLNPHHKSNYTDPKKNSSKLDYLTLKASSLKHSSNILALIQIKRDKILKSALKMLLQLKR
jgi:hypothetical protein